MPCVGGLLQRVRQRRAVDRRDHQDFLLLGDHVLDLVELGRDVVVGVLQVGLVALGLKHLDHVVAVGDPARRRLGRHRDADRRLVRRLRRSRDGEHAERDRRREFHQLHAFLLGQSWPARLRPPNSPGYLAPTCAGVTDTRPFPARALEGPVRVATNGMSIRSTVQPALERTASLSSGCVILPIVSLRRLFALYRSLCWHASDDRAIAAGTMRGLPATGPALVCYALRARVSPKSSHATSSAQRTD